jgi:hypothetical protein
MDVVDALKKVEGELIMAIEFTDGDGILEVVTFPSGRMKFSNSQSCCEQRYMEADACDLGYYIGAVLQGAELRDAPDIEEGDDALTKPLYRQRVVKSRKGKGAYTRKPRHPRG